MKGTRCLGALVLSKVAAGRLAVYEPTHRRPSIASCIELHWPRASKWTVNQVDRFAEAVRRGGSADEPCRAAGHAVDADVHFAEPDAGKGQDLVEEAIQRGGKGCDEAGNA